MNHNPNLDKPFLEVALLAQEQIDRGGVVYQKFTCEECGERNTMDTPNVFYTEGHCGACGHITDLKEKGCGFLLHLSI